MTTNSWLKLAVWVVIGLGGSLLPGRAIAADFQQAEVDPSKFITIAVPMATPPRNSWAPTHQLLILEQVSNARPCWQISQSSIPTVVEPLLLNFDFTGICSRSLDSNGYSVRVGGQDLAEDYSLRIVRRDNDLVLVAAGRGINAPQFPIGHTYGVPNGSVAIYLDPGWRLTRRVYNGRATGHIYLTNDQPLSVVMSAPPPTQSPPPLNAINNTNPAATFGNTPPRTTALPPSTVTGTEAPFPTPSFSNPTAPVPQPQPQLQPPPPRPTATAAPSSATSSPPNSTPNSATSNGLPSLEASRPVPPPPLAPSPQSVPSPTGLDPFANIPPVATPSPTPSASVGTTPPSPVAPVRELEFSQNPAAPTPSPPRPLPPPVSQPGPMANAGSAANTQYQVIVPASTADLQLRVRAAVPNAFPVLINGQIAMQVGLFQELSEAETLQRSLLIRRFGAVILPLAAQ
ncbi:MAG TPA: DUF3747 domain-containing protein [Chroococcidiopsis sp.]